eukprot:Tbor_TRINITY_DN5355_c3_g1::TRINITY_DN5355_c3_g1_i3::g.4666::m.4666
MTSTDQSDEQLRVRVYQGLQKKQRCGLCEQDFYIDELPGAITYKSILELRNKWCKSDNNNNNNNNNISDGTSYGYSDVLGHAVPSAVWDFIRSIAEDSHDNNNNNKDKDNNNNSIVSPHVTIAKGLLRCII